MRSNSCSRMNCSCRNARTSSNTHLDLNLIVGEKTSAVVELRSHGPPSNSLSRKRNCFGDSMAIEIVVTTDRFRTDPASRDFVEHVRSRQDDLGLSQAVLYYDFPAYVDYDAEVNRPDILLFSPSHGFFAIRFVGDSMFRRSKESAAALDEGLNDFSSNLYARLLRSRELRASRTEALVDVFPVIFDTSADGTTDDYESKIVHSLEEFDRFLGDSCKPALGEATVAEIRSVVEGAKALSRPQKRVIEDPKAQPLAVAMAKLEAEIANFDQKQRHIALVDVGGPARIRGLAGSGKTVILAMKVAHLHLNNPSATILITFFTKSLRATIKNLITKFYRHYSEADPDWKVIHIRHGWGGRSVPGVYSDACRRAGQTALTLPEANRLAKRNESPFSAACAALNETEQVRPYYDHVLIDEGQDFPPSFYQLCYRLTKGERDRKSIVWAYDELQDIMNVKIRQPDELFGIDNDGQPRVLLDRSSANMPPGATNDAILSKCYRNQRDVLVTAHAMGFGVYGTIVQMLESAEHWQDVGYDVLSGPLVTGKKVDVVRPDRNSPVQIPATDGIALVDSYAGSSLENEASWVAGEITKFVSAGLQPDEIAVISLDDRHAKSYLSKVAEQLSLLGIASNNIIADPYNEPPFTIPNRVSLSTVYRAKGNEAAAVFAVGVDAVDTKTRDGRNKLFTAFSRSKAWLRVSGIGQLPILQELSKATSTAPAIKFTMPNLDEIETIQRGLSRKQSKAKAARDEYIRKLRAAGYSDDEIDEELAMGADK